MKRSIILAITALASIPAVATAAPVRPKCVIQNDAQIAVTVKEMMRETDTNHDTYVTKAEMAAFGVRQGDMPWINARRWNGIDLDRDGRISVSEAEGLFRGINRRQCGKRR